MTFAPLSSRAAVICLGATLCSIALGSCSTAAIPPASTEAELKARCESRSGRWHDGDPMRSFCEYDSKFSRVRVPRE